jgi:hypothetical protein
MCRLLACGYLVITLWETPPVYWCLSKCSLSSACGEQSLKDSLKNVLTIKSLFKCSVYSVLLVRCKKAPELDRFT